MGLRTNISDVRLKLKQASSSIERIAHAELEDAMKSIFADTQIKVPVATGALKLTGSLRSTGPLSWVIKYGDSDVDGVGVDYAAAVHNRRAHHAAPTGEKYVEEPLLAGIPKLEAAVIRAIRRSLA